MGIRFRRSSPHLTYTPPPAALVRREGEQIVERIRRRTQSGIDEDGKRFAPYADDPGAVVDLYASGDMQKNLQVTTATGRYLRIGFTRSKEALKAIWHVEGTKSRRRAAEAQRFTKGWGLFTEGRRKRGTKGPGGLPPRHWLGLDPKWVRDMAARLVKAARIR